MMADELVEAERIFRDMAERNDRAHHLHVLLAEYDRRGPVVEAVTVLVSAWRDASPEARDGVCRADGTVGEAIYRVTAAVEVRHENKETP